MFRTTILGLMVALLLPTTATADQVAQLSQRRTRLKSHQVKLEKLLSGQVARIGRLKAQPIGVRRDFQLSAALRDNQQLASKLTTLQGQMKALNQRLIATYDRTLAATTDKATRASLVKRRALLRRKLTSRSASRIVTKGKAELLDDPEDLEEKADLLKDSESKLRRQLRRVKKQISRIKLRSKLRRHGRGVDDSLFVEDSPRRTARAKPNTRSSAAPETADTTARAPKANEGGTLQGGAGPATPAPPPTGTSNDKFSGATDPKVGYDSEAARSAAGAAPLRGSSAGTSSSGSGLGLSVRGVLDPSILRELRKAQKSGNLKQRLAALKKAQQRLRQMANRLGTRAKDLRTRAKRRRRGK
jgi:hypothetical protein